MSTDPYVPPPTTAPPPKSRSGCLTALYIVLGVGTVLVLLTAIGIWVFLRSERGQQLVGVAREGIALVQEATTAPGTDALRASGCMQALVMSSSRIREIVKTVAPEAPLDELDELGVDRLVFCQAPAVDRAPGCSEVARTYAGAIGDVPQQFGVMVQAGSGRNATQCQGVYTPDGTIVRSFESEPPPGVVERP